MSIGEGTGTDFSTMRGRNYPTIRQFTFFLDNRLGQMLDVVRRFAGSQVRVDFIGGEPGLEHVAAITSRINRALAGIRASEAAGRPITHTVIERFAINPGPTWPRYRGGHR